MMIRIWSKRWRNNPKSKYLIYLIISKVKLGQFSKVNAVMRSNQLCSCTNQLTERQNCRLKLIESHLKFIETQLKSSVETQLKIIENELKLIENQLKLIKNHYTSVENSLKLINQFQSLGQDLGCCTNLKGKNTLK